MHACIAYIFAVLFFFFFFFFVFFFVFFFLLLCLFPSFPRQFLFCSAALCSDGVVSFIAIAIAIAVSLREKPLQERNRLPLPLLFGFPFFRPLLSLHREEKRHGRRARFCCLRMQVPQRSQDILAICDMEDSSSSCSCPCCSSSCAGEC
jgi:hypothetical protein